MHPGNPSRTSPTPPTSLPISKHRGRCFPRGGSDVTVWPHSSLTPPQEPLSAPTTSSSHTRRSAVVYFSFLGSLFHCLSRLTCRSAPELYFVLSTFRADLQFMYINIFSFSLRINILLPFLLVPLPRPFPRA